MTICGRHKVNGVHGVCEDCEKLDTIEILESRILALEAREKELEEQKETLHELLDMDQKDFQRVIKLEEENSRLREVVDAATGLLKAMTKQSHWARKAVEPEAFALSDIICELDGDGTLTHEESKKHSEAIKSLFKCRSTRCRA